MQKLSKHFPYIFLGLATLITILFSINNIFISAGDTSKMWFSILNEFNRGMDNYRATPFLFAGQNLNEIYGHLPFWHLLSLLNVDYITINNFSYLVFIVITYAFIKINLKPIYHTLSIPQEIVLVLLCFNPVFLNRFTAGHFNLLFGIFPFITFLTLYKKQTKFTYLFMITACWFAFSIQSYQIITYTLLFSPIIVLSNYLTKGSLFLYLRRLFIVFIPAIILSTPSIIEFFSYISTNNHGRSLTDNVVYSYTTSNLTHIPSLFFSGLHNLSMPFNQFYFHEINYPLGITIFYILFSKDYSRNIKLFVSSTYLILFLFTMNTPLFNLIAELPLVQSFRVPQRIFILPALFIYFLFLKSNLHLFNAKNTLALVVMIIFGNFIPYFDIVLIAIGLVSFSIKPNREIKGSLLAISLASIFMGIYPKIHEVEVENKNFNTNFEILKKIDSAFKLSSKNYIHFEGTNKFFMTAYSPLLNIKTIEGYGHPPRQLIQLKDQYNGTETNITSNLFQLNHKSRAFNYFLNKFKFEASVHISNKGNVKYEEYRYKK